MSRRARVVVAYATVKVLDVGGWTVKGFYQDSILPEQADPENVANLVRREYAEWVDAPAPEPAPEPEKPKKSAPAKAGD